MKFLQELFAFSTVPAEGETNVPRLTLTQKSVLVGIYAAATPELAFEAMTGSQNVFEAGKQLRSLGLISIDVDDARAGVTDAGQEALANNNLVDDMGELTEEGQNLLSQHNQIKSEFENATESVAFPILKNLI